MKTFDFIKRKINPLKYWKKKGLIIGSDCDVNSSASFGSEPYLINVGRHVRINAGVHFITHDGGVWVIRELHQESYKNFDLINTIVVGNNVHIGTNAIIMPGVHIGDNCIIGCGAIVTHDVPDNSIAVGVPARVIETIDFYINKHINDFVNTKNMTPEDKKNFLCNKYFDKK